MKWELTFFKRPVAHSFVFVCQPEKGQKQTNNSAEIKLFQQKYKPVDVKLKYHNELQFSAR